MIAQKLPRPLPADLSAAQTRKVESMSELVAEMLLDADATLPPPPSHPSAAGFSGVHFSPRPSSVDDTIPRFRSRTPWIVLGLVVLLVLAGSAAYALDLVVLP